MNIKTRLIISNSYNPYENLALEEYLLKNVQDGEVILYLWQNENTIVIGKNQNPWKECRVSLAEEELYSLEKQLQTIIGAVQCLGINPVFKGKNDIVANDQKLI